MPVAVTLVSLLLVADSDENELGEYRIQNKTKRRTDITRNKGKTESRVSPFFRYEVKLWASRRKEAALIFCSPYLTAIQGGVTPGSSTRAA